ncbi:MAG: methyltransferase domain-containing protein, partial [Candidatus Omnitrophota bacterium]|nr:methyltransferase domain-containing protein [Candidatus Omnitrophota bacterium]
MEKTDISWSNLTRWRTECHNKYGQEFDLPLIQFASPEFQKLLYPESRVLDIGASIAKTHQKFVNQLGQKYYSLDIDPSGDFDFSSFEDIPPEEMFDVMIDHQVFEHISLFSALDLLRSAYQHLHPGGSIIATVPNPAHPVRQWADATHVQHWPYFDLYGLFREADFQVIKM